jgi:ATP-dependent DNA helicase DinG
LNDILHYFPLEAAREKQIRACQFIQRKVEEGYKDIVIAAPTGVGKSAIGVAAAFWMASHSPPSVDVNRGAYYLVTQKLLQDQITDDIPHYRECCQHGCSIKSSDEYPCPEYDSCGAGKRLSGTAARISKMSPEKLARFTPEELAKKKKICACISDGTCSYNVAKSQWMNATVSITNYAYFFTAKLYTSDLKRRQMLVLDECHGLEEQIIKFVDGAVSLSQVKKWTGWESLPEFKGLDAYLLWVEKEYVPKLAEVYSSLEELEILADVGDTRAGKEIAELDKYICKLNRAVSQLKINRDNWVFWKEESLDKEDLQYVVRPVFGKPFVPGLVQSMADVRLYLSAYPGIPSVFCRNLGLDPKKVAWASLGSDFPVENRKVHSWQMGSMGSSSKLESMPRILKTVVRLAQNHEDERGLIHCNSYELGNAIHDALDKSGYGSRVTFPKNADEREAAFKRHIENPSSILISPSMTEGFDFANDKARWQIIPKVAYPFLGDKQIARKLELDEEWYTMRTVMTTIQACGRVVRSNSDHGVTYILDSDFKRLWDKASWMFPTWFKDAVIFH